jgi:hypothetical protein
LIYVISLRLKSNFQIATYLFVIIFLQLASGARANSISVTPHIYSGERGNEPLQQLNGLALIKSNHSPHWNLEMHLESETTGRRDISLDIDRLWIAYPWNSGQFYFGRIHPFDVSNFFQKDDGWSLLGENQTQNRGILLGYRYQGTSEPKPIIQGWVGIHYWSDSTRKKLFQWGASFSPLFIPSQGSELTIYKDSSPFASRFSRRPPSIVQLSNGATLPIYYEIDRTHLLTDVLLQPQAQAQLYLKSHEENPTSETWMTLQRAPSPDPNLKSLRENVVVDGNNVYVSALIKPEFQQMWSATLSEKINLIEIPIISYTYFNFLVNSTQWGWESGIGNKYLKVSLLNRGNHTAQSNQDYILDDANYSAWLAQLDSSITLFSNFQIYSGVKYHIVQKDFWFRFSIGTPISKQFSLQSGIDIFSGVDKSYFGEWRTNDRLFVSLIWQLEN